MRFTKRQVAEKIEAERRESRSAAAYSVDQERKRGESRLDDARLAARASGFAWGTVFGLVLSFGVYVAVRYYQLP